MVYSHICPKHGYQLGAECPKCAEADTHQVDAPAIKTDEWVKGYWNDIDSKPIYIESKKHLFVECEKRGFLPKAFMKPRSQGVGYELKRR